MVHLVREIYHRTHSLKDLKDNQLYELYVAIMIKTLGLSLIGIFIPVYLYQLGYSVESIALFFALTYAIRILTDNIAAWLTGYFGPKHIMILSHIFLVLTLVMLLTLETIAWPLALIAALNAVSSGFFFTSYHIEFSKLNSESRAGHEIGVMYKVGKFASAIGPLLGGIIATVASVQLSIVAAIALILVSAVPLSLSPEPVRKHQHISWRGMPWGKIKWDIASNISLNFDQMSSLFIWPLYLSIFIFSENIYLSVGLVTSLGLAVSVFAATIYGKITDQNKGSRLLKLGVMGASISHFIRPFISSVGGAVGFNLVNDSMSIAIRIPYTKGLYAAASDIEGYRNVYISAFMTSSNIMRLIVFVVLYLLLGNNSVQTSMQIIFVIAGVTIWGATLNRFRALR